VDKIFVTTQVDHLAQQQQLGYYLFSHTKPQRIIPYIFFVWGSFSHFHPLFVLLSRSQVPTWERIFSSSAWCYQNRQPACM